MSFSPQDQAFLRSLMTEVATSVVRKELQPMQEQIDTIRNADLKPLSGRIEELEGVRSKHSDIHKGLAEDVRKTGEHARLDMVAHVSQQLSAFRTEVENRLPAKVTSRAEGRIKTIGTIIAMVIIAVINHWK